MWVAILRNQKWDQDHLNVPDNRTGVNKVDVITTMCPHTIVLARFFGEHRRSHCPAAVSTWVGAGIICNFFRNETKKCIIRVKKYAYIFDSDKHYWINEWLFKNQLSFENQISIVYRASFNNILFQQIKEMPISAI